MPGGLGHSCSWNRHKGRDQACSELNGLPLRLHNPSRLREIGLPAMGSRRPLHGDQWLQATARQDKGWGCTMP